MMNLLTILLVLFAVLAIVVKVTEKHAKPMSAEQQSKLWPIIAVLVFAGLIVQLIQHATSG